MNYFNIKAVVFFLQVFFIIILNNDLSGQSSVKTIKGRVLDEERKPVIRATVSLSDEKNNILLEVATDTAGRFSFRYSKQADYILWITSLSYNSYRSEPFPLSDKDFGSVILTSSVTNLKDVVVNSKQKTLTLDGSSIVYNISKTINGQGLNGLDALKMAPGVYIENESNITLNGKQGVQIMLDGKQTYLSGKEMTDFLKSLPSSSLRSIEIINSPSAKYDAAGTAGIINIKTNRSQVRGFNGVITTGLSYGVTAKQNTDLSLNYRNDRLNLYGSYSHFLGNYKYLYGADRMQNDKTYNSDTDDTDKRKKMAARLGLDYTINQKNIIGVLVSSNFLFGGGITDTDTDIGTTSNSIEQTLSGYNDYYSQHTNRYNFNINYKYEDSLGRMLNIDADYGDFAKGNGNLQSNIYRDPQSVLLASNLYRTLNEIDIDMKGLKVDYSSNLWTGKLESGLKYSSVGSANDSRFLHVGGNSDSLDNRRSNNFIYNEKIASAYLSYKKIISKWTFQAGLRLENTKSEGTLHYRTSTADSLNSINRNYTNLFPAFSLSVNPGKGNSFSLSYSSRIQRPAYQDLNPFVYLLDELSFWQGNPFLRPQLTQQLSLQYARKSSTVIMLNYSLTNRFSANITDTLEQEKVVMVTRNVGTQKNLSFSLTQSLSPLKCWDLMFNGTMYYLRNDIAFDEYRNMNLTQLAGMLNLQQTVKLPFKLSAEVVSAFNTSKLTGANNFVRPTSQISLGLQKILLDNKATVRLSFNDIYKGSRTRSIQRFEGFYSSNYGYFESRQIRLNFTYKFANSQIKGPRSRNSSLDNESGRIK